MFKIHIGDTPHRSAPEEFRKLGEATDGAAAGISRSQLIIHSGYSGADISIVVREALMHPVRFVQNATHFKKVMAIAPDSACPAILPRFFAAALRCRSAGQPREYLTPCSPGDPMAMEMTWMDVPGDKLLEPLVRQGKKYRRLLTLLQISYNDFLKSIKNTRPSVSPADLVLHEKFTRGMQFLCGRHP